MAQYLQGMVGGHGPRPLHGWGRGAVQQLQRILHCGKTAMRKGLDEHRTADTLLDEPQRHKVDRGLELAQPASSHGSPWPECCQGPLSPPHHCPACQQASSPCPALHNPLSLEFQTQVK